MSLDAYTEILARHGRSLKDIGSADVVLPRLMALKAINTLRGLNVVILGVDVVRIKDGFPEYTYDNAHCEPEDYTSSEDYRKGSLEKIARYLMNYPDPLDGTIWYALSVLELPRHSELDRP